MTTKKKAAGTKKPPKPLDDEDLKIPVIAGVSIEPAATGPSGPELKQLLGEFMASQNKNKDHRVIAFASDVPNTYELRRPSGIMQLDIDTAGGLPAGGLSYISGPDGAGKTHLVMLYMLMHQKLYGEEACMAYAGAEGGFDFRRAVRMGLKIPVPDKLLDQWSAELVARGLPAYTEEDRNYYKQGIGQLAFIGGHTGEEILQATLNAVRTRLFGIIAVDSISVLLPEADADKDLDENNKRAANASLVTDFIKHYTPLTSGLDGLNYTSLIFTAQVRSNQERANANPAMQKYIKQWATTGAYAGKHGKLIDVCVWNGEKIHQTVNKERQTVGKETKYELMKGKAGAHENVLGSYPFFYAYPTGVDQYDSIITTGLRLGVIRERNGMIDVIRPETGKPSELRDIPGFSNFRRMMEVDFEFELAVRREILAAKGVHCLYR